METEPVFILNFKIKVCGAETDGRPRPLTAFTHRQDSQPGPAGCTLLIHFPSPLIELLKNDGKFLSFSHTPFQNRRIAIFGVRTIVFASAPLFSPLPATIDFSTSIRSISIARSMELLKNYIHMHDGYRSFPRTAPRARHYPFQFRSHQLIRCSPASFPPFSSSLPLSTHSHFFLLLSSPLLVRLGRCLSPKHEIIVIDQPLSNPTKIDKPNQHYLHLIHELWGNPQNSWRTSTLFLFFFLLFTCSPFTFCNLTGHRCFEAGRRGRRPNKVSVFHASAPTNTHAHTQQQ